MLIYNSKEILDYVVENRRYLHSIPELGGELPKTQEFVAKKLDELNVKYVKNKKDSGIIANISGNGNSKKVVALRADMDALPIVEETDYDYKSCNNNMHACGHDAHTAILLGAAKILSENRDKFDGTVRLLFQTGEETGTGAKIMIEENALSDVSAIFGIHVGGPSMDIPNGVFFIKEGPVMASTDRIIIKVKGKGAHGAYPCLGVDPIVISADIINSLQTIITREIDAADPVIFSICKINGGTAFNVVPDTVEMEGTLRTFNNDVRDFFIQRMKEKIESICHSMRGDYDIKIIEFAKVTFNDKTITDNVMRVAKNIFTEEAVCSKNYNPSMGGEDFSYYLEKVPGCFAFFSTLTDNKVPHHNSKFEVNETKLNMPSELMANWVLDCLQNK